MAALDEATIASKLDKLDVSDGAATTADATEPPFAIKYDPRDVAKLAAHEKVEDYPPRALPTGEVALAPQFHLVGAHCGRGFLACDCETTQEIPVGTDYHFSGLPAPGSTRSSLLRRWASCVKMSPTMGAFAADAWFDEHGARTIKALEQRGGVLARMVDDFCADLDEDPNLPILCQLGGIPEGFPAHEAVDVVAGEARAARGAFVAGDWNCVAARAEIFKMTSMCISFENATRENGSSKKTQPNRLRFDREFSKFRRDDRRSISAVDFRSRSSARRCSTRRSRRRTRTPTPPTTRCWTTSSRGSTSW